jgi:predicted ATPase/DNA-binding winged helix-turn-helix (wHTH) protein
VLPEDSPQVYASGECEIDLGRRELRVLGSPVPVGGRAFEIIEILARSAGELITKDELINRIWPGAIVTENTLQVHAVAIRKALGPYRSLLKTESRRGYRLLGDWTVRRHDAARPPVGLQRMRVDGESPVTNFPAIVTRLIGRSAVVARLRDFISAYRAVTLTGPGGIGKTVLALKVARGVVGEFADGGWLVELASLSDPALVPVAVAGVLRLGVGPISVTAETVARAIGDKRLLLVLDNCEHLIEAVATLAETFLANCAHITIVATSREILRIQGEHIWRVPPLEVPAARQIETAEILGHGAVELFLMRARELGADFSSNPQYPRVVASICRHLDGIPLAIEFAAAHAATLGVELVASGLRDRFALLTGGRRTALPRHRTLRATLDWSYRLLSEAERDLLQGLAIFAGQFSLDGARAVAVESTSDVKIADGIADLVGKSLVFRIADPVATEFRLLETTRVYAIDRLTESGAFAEIARRHAAYCLTALGDVDDERKSKPPDQYLAVFRRRADEVHVALDWAFSDIGDRAIGVALTLAAFPLWFELFQMTVARFRANQALSYVALGSHQEMRLRVGFGHAIWYMTSESDKLEPTFARALEIAERLDDSSVRTHVLWGMWGAHRARGEYRTALSMARRYADAARETGDAGAVHLGDRILGLTHHYLGEQSSARQFAERALREPRQIESVASIGYQVETPVAMATLLARILWLQGFPDQALAATREAINAARQNSHLFPMFYALILAGLPAALWVGDLDEAHRQLDVLKVHGAGDPSMEPWVRCFAGVINLREGNERDALIGAFVEARIDIPPLRALADLLSRSEANLPPPGPEPDDALWNTPELLRVDAELLLWHNAPGAATAAEAKLLRALEIARAQSALSWELRCSLSLARLWRRHGRATEARELLAATYGKFTEGFGTGDLVRANPAGDRVAARIAGSSDGTRRWCMKELKLGFYPWFADYLIRMEIGIPRLVIRFRTLHAILASVF